MVYVESQLVIEQETLTESQLEGRGQQNLMESQLEGEG